MTLSAEAKSIAVPRTSCESILRHSMAKRNKEKGIYHGTVLRDGKFKRSRQRIASFLPDST